MGIKAHLEKISMEHKWIGHKNPNTADDPGEYVEYCLKCGMERPASWPDMNLPACISDEQAAKPPSFKFGPNVKQKVYSERKRLLECQLVALGKSGPKLLATCPACGNVAPVGTDWRSMICWKCEHEFDLPIQLAPGGSPIAIVAKWVDIEESITEARQAQFRLSAMGTAEIRLAAMVTGTPPWTPEPSNIPLCSDHPIDISPHAFPSENLFFARCAKCKRFWSAPFREKPGDLLVWTERFLGDNGQILPLKEETWRDRPGLL